MAAKAIDLLDGRQHTVGTKECRARRGKASATRALHASHAMHRERGAAAALGTPRFRARPRSAFGVRRARAAGARRLRVPQRQRREDGGRVRRRSESRKEAQACLARPIRVMCRTAVQGRAGGFARASCSCGLGAMLRQHLARPAPMATARSTRSRVQARHASHTCVCVCVGRSAHRRDGARHYLARAWHPAVFLARGGRGDRPASHVGIPDRLGRATGACVCVCVLEGSPGSRRPWIVKPVRPSARLPFAMKCAARVRSPTRRNERRGGCRIEADGDAWHTKRQPQRCAVPCRAAGHGMIWCPCGRARTGGQTVSCLHTLACRHTFLVRRESARESARVCGQIVPGHAVIIPHMKWRPSQRIKPSGTPDPLCPAMAISSTLFRLRARPIPPSVRCATPRRAAPRRAAPSSSSS